MWWRWEFLTDEISGRPSSASRSNKSTLLSAFHASNFSQLIHLCCCSTVGLGKAPIHSKVDTTRSPRHMALRRRFSKQCSVRIELVQWRSSSTMVESSYRYVLSAPSVHHLQEMANSALGASTFEPSAGKTIISSHQWKRKSTKLTTQWISW